MTLWITQNYNRALSWKLRFFSSENENLVPVSLPPVWCSQPWSTTWRRGGGGEGTHRHPYLHRQHHEVHLQEDGHKKYDLNFNLGSGKQLQEVDFDDKELQYDDCIEVSFDLATFATITCCQCIGVSFHLTTFATITCWHQLNEIAGELEKAGGSEEKMQVLSRLV